MDPNELIAHYHKQAHFARRYAAAAAHRCDFQQEARWQDCAIHYFRKAKTLSTALGQESAPLLKQAA